MPLFLAPDQITNLGIHFAITDVIKKLYEAIIVFHVVNKAYI